MRICIFKFFNRLLRRKRPFIDGAKNGIDVLYITFITLKPSETAATSETSETSETFATCPRRDQSPVVEAVVGPNVIKSH